MFFAVQNKSTRVTEAEAMSMAQAAHFQMYYNLSPVWGLVPLPVIYFPPTMQLPTYSIPALLFDNSDQANALGYHTETPDGQFFLRAFAAPVLDNGGVVLGDTNGSPSVASVLTHETCETVVDRTVNEWVDGPTIDQGSSYAKEVCDPVESDSYLLRLSDQTIVSVSNFVTPAWFDSAAPTNMPRDFMGRVASSFTMSPGGYMVVRSAPGTEQDVFGATPRPTWRSQLSHPASRSMRRKAG